MSRKSILLVSPYSAQKVGGIGTWTKNILDYSKEQGDQIIFLNTASRFKSNLAKRTKYRIFVGAIDTLGILIRFVYQLIITRPKVVHYTSSASYALYKDLLAIYLSRLLGAKFIIHFHFGRIPELRESKNREWVMLCRVIRAATQVIVIDDASYHVLIAEGFQNIHNIPNPISSELQLLSQNTTPNMNSRIQGSVLFVGHVIPTKGISELVSACCHTEAVKTLNIIGPYNQKYREKLEAISKQRDNGSWLHFVGEISRSKVFEYYLNTNLLAFPSYTEGFPNVILETMALACPIIATPVGAIPQMLDINTTTPAGMIVPIRNVVKLESAIAMLLQDTALATKLSNNAHNRVLSKYTLDKSYSKLQQIWEL